MHTVVVPLDEKMILDFFQSTYQVRATMGARDRAALKQPAPLSHRHGGRR